MYFATFGSSQLKEFDLFQAPMNTLVTIKDASEEELRKALFESSIGSNFCTTYAMEHKKEFPEGKLIELKDLLKHSKNRNFSLQEMRGY